MSKLVSKAHGVLFGQAIGDALGARYEFTSATEATERVLADKATARVVPILGGGPFKMSAGQVTDDTEMAVALARSLTRKGTVDIYDIASSYFTWYRSNPPDIGRTTAGAFSNVKQIGDTKAMYETIVRTSRLLGGQSLSNGCLMRISPLAIAAARWPDEGRLHDSAIADARMTNPHPVTCDAVRVYVTALRALINSDGTDVATAEGAYQKALAVAETEVVRGHLVAAAGPQLFPVATSEKKLMSADKSSIGYVGLALQIAFYELLHAETFEGSLERVVGLGGDTDTNGCIAGALLGARFGEEGIPAEWKASIVGADPRERLAVYPWASLKDLVALADALLKCEPPGAMPKVE